MLEWMIAAGVICGALGTFGGLFLALKGLWNWRIDTREGRGPRGAGELPNAPELPTARLLRDRHCRDLPRDAIRL